MEIDKLVQLLESPVFLQLRMHLISTGEENQPRLLEALYGLLMLLPQSSAYDVLQKRLSAASSMHMALHALSITNLPESKQSNDQSSEIELLNHFISVQVRRSKAQDSLIRQRQI
mmetsp:Transcript_729/g.896  ORF Transcript_729/g.896 Transcript_729/m.896 type:complete len:115 (-) Transcript_729:855-1199(-)